MGALAILLPCHTPHPAFICPTDPIILFPYQSVGVPTPSCISTFGCRLAFVPAALSVRLCLYLRRLVHLSGHLFGCACWSVHLSVYQSVRLSICPSNGPKRAATAHIRFPVSYPKENRSPFCCCLLTADPNENSSRCISQM